jgi:hypothetical protein
MPFHVQSEGAGSLTPQVLETVQQWRFNMPDDGTSPVLADARFETFEKELVLLNIGYRAPALSEGPPPAFDDAPEVNRMEGRADQELGRPYRNRKPMGDVDNAYVIGGPEPLRQAALDGALQWRFRPRPSSLHRDVKISVSIDPSSKARESR